VKQKSVDSANCRNILIAAPSLDPIGKKVTRKMTSNRCQHCGLVNFAGTAECRRCKAPIPWAAEGCASQPAFSSQPAIGAGGGPSYQPQQPFQVVPNYGATGGADALPYAQGPKLRSGLATASLVLGILGVFSLGILLIGAVIGLILGVRAVLKANREPSVYGGKGVAIGGIVANSFGILTIVPVALIAAIAIPNLMMARMAANEASAIGHLRTLATAEATYQSTVGGGRSFGSMQELIASGAIAANSTSKNGYQFNVRLLDLNGKAALAGAGDAVGFEVVATPDSYGSTGRRSFYVSEQYVIRCADKSGKEATRSDPDVDEYFRQQEPAFEQGRPRGRGYAPGRRD
jgi:type IV pilus assembly protein PilA